MSDDTRPNETVAHAKEVIKDIRVEHGVDEDLLRKVGNDPQIQRVWFSREKQLKHALKELSHGLYTKDTHFILELIQNADDNRYSAGVMPTLRFQLLDRNVKILCNEVGFREDNVRAISKIGESTKTLGESKGYIGEKGIGFKSVFKAADIVYISSPPYTFKFDTRVVAGQDHLGMLAPTWFNPSASDYVSLFQTHITMQLSASCDTQLLENELASIDPAILLFLLKLKRLEIAFPTKPSRTFTRQDILGIPNVKILKNVATTGLFPAPLDVSYFYFVHRFTASSLPHDSRRAGITSSEIVLAFPLQYGEPHIISQLVYAYLPLKDFGFKFVIQADFLVPSNREDIQSCQWNEVLRDRIPAAFVASVGHFLKEKKTKYTWMRFIPTAYLPNSFLCDLAGPFGQILSSLRSTPILYSRSGKVRKASDLKVVPVKYQDRHKRPFLGGLADFDNQLSPGYAAQDIPTLNILGLHTMTAYDFVAKLLLMTDHDFKSRSTEWHEDLANALLSGEFTEHPTLYNCVKEIPLIPLRGGQWVSASTIRYPIYLDPGNSDLSIPANLEVLVVDLEATSNPQREKFFRRLGVRDCDRHEICKLILNKHRQLPPSTQTQELILHAVYLFTNRTLLKFMDVDSLWLVSSKDDLRKGTSLYMDTPDSKPKLSSLFDASSYVIEYLHPNYLSAVSDFQKREWYAWIINTLHVSDIPRLSCRVHGDYSLSPEFMSITRRHHSKVWLKLLVVNWHRYSSEISRLQSRISSLEVECSGGKRRLRDAVLPLAEIVEALNVLGSQGLPLLELENEDLSSYTVLKTFGVTTSTTLDLYLIVLQFMSRKLRPSTSVIRNVYKRIEAFLTLEPYKVYDVRTKFFDSPLIYVPTIPDLPGEPEQYWVESSKCLWSAPSCVRFKFYSLQNHYPTCSQFFREHLSMRNAVGTDLVDEIIHVRQASPPKPSKTILLALSNYLNSATFRASAKLYSLKLVRCFPVKYSAERIYYISCSEAFFIPDQQSLVNTFQGRLPLLDLSVDETRSLKPFFELLQISDRSLRACVKVICEPIGEEVEDAYLTDNLRSKSGYLYRCWKRFKQPLRSQEQENHQVHSRLKEIRVCRVQQVNSRQSVSSQGCNVSTEATSEMYLRTTPGPLTLFLAKNRRDLTVVFARYLPQQLMEVFSISDPRAINIISNILLLSGAEVEELLDQEDVADLPESERVSLGIASNHAARATNMSEMDQLTSSLMGMSLRRPSSHAESSLNGFAISQIRPNANAGIPNTTPEISMSSTDHNPSTPLRPVLSSSSSGPRPSLREQSSLGSPPPPLSRPPSLPVNGPSGRSTSGRFESPRPSATLSPTPLGSGVSNSSASSAPPLLADEEVEEVTNQQARPSSEEIQRIFPDFEAKMRNLVSSSLEVAEPNLVVADRSTTAFDNIQSLASHLPSAASGRRRSGRPASLPSVENVDETYAAGSRNRTTRQQKVDFGIGFFGEFFVVNYLLSTVSFNVEESWTSSLRGYARAYEDFKDLPDYGQREISDITYADEAGEFTRWLISRGYAQAEPWLDKPPKYHIEVKTTTRACSERFFMSNHQAKLMKSMAIPAGDVIPEDVYVIFRVFNIETSPEINVYLDPWALCQRKALFLCPEAFSVTTSPGDSWVMDCANWDLQEQES